MARILLRFNCCRCKVQGFRVKKIPVITEKVVEVALSVEALFEFYLVGFLGALSPAISLSYLLLWSNCNAPKHLCPQICSKNVLLNFQYLHLWLYAEKKCQKIILEVYRGLITLSVFPTSLGAFFGRALCLISYWLQKNLCFSLRFYLHHNASVSLISFKVP